MSQASKTDVSGLPATAVRLAMEGPSKPELKVSNNKDGTHTGTYSPTQAGDYKLSVIFGGKHIPGSPFAIKVTGEAIKSAASKKKVMAWNWGYSRSNGPEVWRKHFPAATGDRQSPIAIGAGDAEYSQELGELKINYKPSKAQLTNTGASWNLTPAESSNCTISAGPLGSSVYKLVGVHAHWPSEHVINNAQYAIEVHLVHLNTKYASVADAMEQPDGLAVIGVFCDDDGDDNDNSRDHVESKRRLNSELEKLLAKLRDVTFKGEAVPIDEEINWGNLVPVSGAKRYYTYAGSLTTPPCSEAVTWILIPEALQTSEKVSQGMSGLCSACRSDGEGLKDLEKIQIQRNARPPQCLNTRKIKKSFQ